MAVTVPSSDVTHFNMQSTITSLTTQIANAKTAGNYSLAAKLTQDQSNVRFQLVQSLIATGHVLAVNVLANEVYGSQPVSEGT